MPIVVKVVTNARDVTCFANSQTPQGVVFKLQPIRLFGLSCSTINNVQRFGLVDKKTPHILLLQREMLLFTKKSIIIILNVERRALLFTMMLFIINIHMMT